MNKKKKNMAFSRVYPNSIDSGAVLCDTYLCKQVSPRYPMDEEVMHTMDSSSTKHSAAASLLVTR